MNKLLDMRVAVNGMKDLKLTSVQTQTLETPEKSRAGETVRVTFPGRGSIFKMSLPGLELPAPVETVTEPVVHELKEQTEWRFEVAFGTKVEVRVWIPGSSALYATFLVQDN